MYKKLSLLTFREKSALLLVTLINIIVLIFILIVDVNESEFITLGYLGVGIVNLINASTIFSPVPAFAVTFFATTLLEPIPLLLISAIVTTIGESTSYFFGHGVSKLVYEYRWHAKLKSYFDRAPFLFLVIWIGIPNPIQSVGQAFAGSTKYNFWKYSFASLIGNFIWFTMVVYFGGIIL